MRKPIIAGNWKMYKTSAEAVELVNSLKPLVKEVTDVEIVIAPVFTVLAKVKEALAGTDIKLSAQDCFWETEGAYTGEISAKMLIDAGCSHAIIGHSERRQYFGETDETVSKKVNSALQSGLHAICCIGETLSEREQEKTFDVLEKQLKGGLAGVPSSALSNLVIAYEPVWAIGTGKTASDEQAQEAHKFIRKVFADLYGASAAQSVRILYGGSVKPENVNGLMGQPDIDGALVGGASLKADSFAGIIKFQKK